MSVVLRSWVVFAAFTCLASGCVEDLPVAGRPCPNGDEDCDDGQDDTDFFCSVVDGNTCLPGVGLQPAVNLSPIVHAAAIVAADGATVRGSFSALDPDGTGPISFSLLGSTPSNGSIDLATDGSYAFIGDLGGGETAQSRFQIQATDRDGGETVATVFAIVLAADSDLLSWTGSASSAFVMPENWTPRQSPTLERSVFLPATSAFAPVLFDEAAVFNFYVGPGRGFRLGRLEIFGDEVFSASSDGQGPLTLRSNPHLFGDLPSLGVYGGAHIDSQVRVSGDLLLAPGSEPFVLDEGASLVVGGAVYQSASASGFLVPDDVAATLQAEGDLHLLGGSSRIGGSTLLVAGDLQIANTIVATSDARLILTGPSPQAVSIGPRGQLPSATSLVGSAVRFVGSGRIAGDFDVGGELSVVSGGHVQVASTLTLRSSFRAGQAIDGRLTATDCMVSPDVIVPNWIECDVAYDAGPGIFDAGAVDAGELDAGVVDAGVVDAGVVDAGVVDAGVVDAGVVDAGDFDAGDFDAGDFDAGVVDAGDFDAGAADAGVADAGGFDAGVTDAGGFDAGVTDAGAPSVDCVAPSERSGDILNGLIVVEAGTSTSMDLSHADPNATVIFISHVLETEGGGSDVTPQGAWTFSAAANAVGYFDVPVSYSTAALVEHDCLRVRVVNPALEFNVVQPSSAVILSGIILWNDPLSWDPPIAPVDATTVFISKAFVHPETEVRVLRRARKLLVETGAVVRIGGNSTLEVSGELALGAGASVEPGEVFVVGPGPTMIASAGPIAAIECGENIVTLASSLRTGALDMGTGCGLDVDDFTLRVNGTLTGSSLTYPTVQMRSPSARILVDGDVDIEFTSATALTAGTLSVTGVTTLTHFLDGAPVTSGEHTLVLEGTGAPSLTSNGTLAHVEVRSPAATFALSSFEMDSVDLGSTSLCVDVLGGPGPDVASVSLESGFSYNQGPAWSLGACTGPTLACAALESGGDNATCVP